MSFLTHLLFVSTSTICAEHCWEFGKKEQLQHGLATWWLWSFASDYIITKCFAEKSSDWNVCLISWICQFCTLQSYMCHLAHLMIYSSQHKWMFVFLVSFHTLWRGRVAPWRLLRWDQLWNPFINRGHNKEHLLGRFISVRLWDGVSE